MPKLKALINRVQTDYPELQFESGEVFTFRPPQTILYNPSVEGAELVLLHELGHYLDKDQDYTSDIALLRIEAEAWQRAKSLSETYQINWDEDFAQAKLDSYRDWLHQASLCPVCEVNGYQDKQGHYHCPLCEKSWHRQEIPEL